MPAQLRHLREIYREEIVPTLRKELSLSNDMAVPRLIKIVISTRVSDPQGRTEALKNMALQLAAITGQHPSLTTAKQSIAGFKLRAGDPIGLRLTLRGKRMYDFLTKLIRVSLPRVKDFQGVRLGGFDGHGNYSLGLTEQLIFPEVNYDKIDKVRGLEVTIVTAAADDRQARRLLELFGMPFEKAQA